uniref:Uncharacterized protein n=1 Tax=Anguilla anguilla TaxID=7936 RepID=A0A0E9W102_ANGAN
MDCSFFFGFSSIF